MQARGYTSQHHDVKFTLLCVQKVEVNFFKSFGLNEIRIDQSSEFYQVDWLGSLEFSLFSKLGYHNSARVANVVSVHLELCGSDAFLGYIRRKRLIGREERKREATVRRYGDLS